MERICIRRVTIVIYGGCRVVGTVNLMKDIINKGLVPKGRVGVRVN